MTDESVQTEHLELVANTRESLLAMVDSMGESDRAEVSPEWLGNVRNAEGLNVWTFGFEVYLTGGEQRVGASLFKGPPVDGRVEIAYGIDEEFRGRGFATEAAKALVEFAKQSGEVAVVRAHTRPEASASTRVLTKSGFEKVGEVEDPEDGPVWRWEIGVE